MSALFSKDGRHRYRLDRQTTFSDRVAKAMTFVMLNPSTADARKDDPTIRRCLGFAARERCTAMTVVNLFSIRSPDPIVLKSPGALNDLRSHVHVVEALAQANFGPLVFAWGRGVEIARDWRKAVAEMETLAREYAGSKPMCLGRTKDGHPRHPLFVRSDQPLEEW